MENKDRCDLLKKIDHIHRLVQIGDNPLTTRVSVLEKSLETTDDRVCELEKHHLQAKIEGNKAKLHILGVLAIGVLGWFAALMKNVDLNIIKRLFNAE